LGGVNRADPAGLSGHCAGFGGDAGSVEAGEDDVRVVAGEVPAGDERALGEQRLEAGGVSAGELADRFQLIAAAGVGGGYDDLPGAARCVGKAGGWAFDGCGVDLGAAFD
jgi:hypothetical protein